MINAQRESNIDIQTSVLALCVHPENPTGESPGCAGQGETEENAMNLKNGFLKDAFGRLKAI